MTTYIVVRSVNAPLSRQREAKIPNAENAENRIVSNGMRQLLFVTLSQTPGLSDATEVSLYLLPVSRGRFDSNVYVTGFATAALYVHEAKI